MRWILIIGGIVLVALLGLMVWEAAHCVRYRETGGLTCVNMGSIINCSPTRECAEWRK